LARRTLDSPWLYLGLAGVLLIVGVYSQVEISLPKRPSGTIDDLASLRDRDDLNVIWILIDTLRADRLGTYGYQRETSPILDAIAESGVRFANVESQSSWTKASMASMWTAMYPQRAGVHHFSHAIPEEARMPAEILQDAGFKTAGIFRNGWVMPNFGFAQGFDLYVRPQVSAQKARVQRPNPSASSLQGTDLDATESAIQFIQSNRESRLFVYVHYMDAHQYLYDDSSTLFGASISDVYDNAIHWTNLNVGTLLKEVEDLGLADRTMIVISSDHGESFFEHGSEGHARTLYSEVQHVPLIIHFPFRLDPGVVVESTVANVDVWPTILDLLGLESIQGADGRSLVPLIEAAARGEEEAEALSDRTVYSQLNAFWGQTNRDPSQIVALVKSPYRFVFYQELDSWQLFDHSNDPREQKDIAPENSELVAAFRKDLDQYLAGTNEHWQAPTIEVDEMRLNQLRALGYSIPENKDNKQKLPQGTRPQKR
jgi:arylsulfatase A-like enzyme